MRVTGGLLGAQAGLHGIVHLGVPADLPAPDACRRLVPGAEGEALAGRSLLIAGDHAGAQAVLRAAAEGGSRRAALFLSHALLASQRPAEALRVLPRGPLAGDARTWREIYAAAAEWALGRRAPAAARLRRAGRGAPRGEARSAADALSAVLAFAGGDAEEALSTAARLSEDPRNSWASVLLAAFSAGRGERRDRVRERREELARLLRSEDERVRASLPGAPPAVRDSWPLLVSAALETGDDALALLSRGARGADRRVLSRLREALDAEGAGKRRRLASSLRGRRAPRVRAAMLRELGRVPRGIGADALVGRLRALIVLGEARRAFALAGRPEAVRAAREASCPRARLRLAATRGDADGVIAASRELGGVSRAEADVQLLRWPYLFSHFDLRADPGLYERLVAPWRRRAPRRRGGPWAAYHFCELARCSPDGKDRDFDLSPLTSPDAPAWMAHIAAERARAAGRIALSARLFDSAARASEPGSWMLAALAGESYLCSGRPASWRDAMARAVAWAPDPASRAAAEAWRAMHLLWLGRAKEALRVGLPAAEAGAVYAWGVVGAALVLLGRHRAALPWLDRRIGAGYHTAEWLIWRSEAQLALGRRARAAADARAAMAARPENPYGAVALARASAAAGDEVGAKDLLASLPPWARRAAGGGRPETALARLLRVSRGVRRQDHETRLWRGDL